MRHRIGGLENTYMGLGADNIPFELDNSWSENKKLNEIADAMLNNALETIFKSRDISGFDFKVDGDLSKFKIYFGIEPAYKYSPYLMCCITSFYKDSYIESGKAHDYYGTDVRVDAHATIVDDNCPKDFLDFVCEWYPKLCEALTIRVVDTINKERGDK